MLSVKIDQANAEVKMWKFPAGECGVKLQFPDINCNPEKLTISWLWESNDEMMALAQIVDAIANKYGDKIYKVLEIPYFPYSRQDRRCSAGEGHALKMFAKFINSFNFDKVITKDAHSYVLEAVVENIYNIEHHVCSGGISNNYDILIAPDAGASKKIYKMLNNGQQVIVANKTRDIDGKIIGMDVDVSLVDKGGKILVADDLCDNGGTFIALGEILREKLGASNKIDLYVTHGFFGKGVDVLLKMYDNVFVHNLMNKSVKNKVVTV